MGIVTGITTVSEVTWIRCTHRYLGAWNANAEDSACRANRFRSAGSGLPTSRRRRSTGPATRWIGRIGWPERPGRSSGGINAPQLTSDRGIRGMGKLIMVCGTGKPFTSLRLADENVGAGGSVLFLVVFDTCQSIDVGRVRFPNQSWMRHFLRWIAVGLLVAALERTRV